MSILTPFFNLFKPAKTDPAAIAEISANMDIIDTEMHRPPLTVNEIEPDPETRDLHIQTVPLADNLSSDEAQVNTGTFIVRTSGGDSSIADGNAWLSDLRGNQVKTGYVPESLNMTVNAAQREEGVDPITATLDRATFVEEVTASGTITLSYITDWSADPATYGVTVTGTPIAGDQIVIVYVKEDRGTITTASPTSFVSTGWNLYNHSVGYARVLNYSEEYGFMVEGTYTKLEFSTTLTGDKTTITPVDGYFTVPADGYVFVTGGNSTDTEIWMTWSDWTDEANGGTFAAYSQTSIDLSGVMVNFPYGLMRIGNVFDEINFNTLRAYSRIQRLEYNTENLENVIASGVDYDTDEGYIYAVRETPVTYTINISGEYTVSDHGLEMYLGTDIPLTSSSLYGQDLKGKLRRDVLTISQQTLTSAQKTQVLTNIGAASQAGLSKFQGVEIAANTNLNSLIVPGNYYSINSGRTETLTNCPVTGEGFTLQVYLRATNTVTQQLVSSNGVAYIRGETSSGFTAWRRIAMAETGNLANNTDLDTILTNCTYRLASANTYTNKPTDTAWGLLECYVPTSTLAVQRLTQPASGNTPDRVYIRSYYNSAWHSWTSEDNEIAGKFTYIESAVSCTLTVQTGGRHFLIVTTSNGAGFWIGYVRSTGSTSLLASEILKGANLNLTVDASTRTLTFANVDGTARAFIINDFPVAGSKRQYITT